MKKLKEWIKKRPVLYCLAVNIYHLTPKYCKKRREISERQKNIFEEYTRIGKGSCIEASYFGYYSACNRNCNIYSAYIGRYVNIAANVTIGPRNHIYENFTNCDFIFSGGGNSSGNMTYSRMSMVPA